MELSIGLAFIAGFISFISPCVLPLVPAYIGYMGGRLTHTVAAQTAGSAQVAASPSWQTRFVTMTHGVAFVLGFTTIFIVLGLITTAFAQRIGGQNVNLVIDIIGRAGGILIIFFGLHFMGVMPALFTRFQQNTALMSNVLVSIVFAGVGVLLIWWAFITPLLILPLAAVFLMVLFITNAFTQPQQFWTNFIERLQTMLYSDTRRQMNASRSQNVGSSAIMGVVFAAGWTPCIGPVYGAVLTMAANGGDIGQAGVLLGAYSLGLGIPFLLTAGLLDSAQGLLRRLQRHMRTIELVSGGFLVLIGLLIATGSLQSLSQRFANQFADFSITLEENVLDAVTGGGAEAAENIEPEAAPADDESASANSLQSITGLAESAPEPAASIEEGINVGQLAVDFTTVNDNGETISLSDLRGQTVLVNFWATWCGPCRIEMPEFEAAFNEYRDDGFTILAVNNQEELEDVLDFRENLEVTFPMVLDESGDIQDLYGIRMYPSTLLIGPDGVIIDRHFGVMTADQLGDMLAEALPS
jgi:cytochrome c-type biogenesis protein